MSSLGGRLKRLATRWRAALVGTFLGILLCYGMVGPLASNLSKLIDEEHAYYHVLRVVMLSFIKGMSPMLAIEMARRAIPEHLRPSFQEVEKSLPPERRFQRGGRGVRRAERAIAIVAECTAESSLSRSGQGPRRTPRGAWKVAYADFVTAMMALFIVLWMMNASKQVQEAVGGYFKDPRGTAKVVGTNKNGSGDYRCHQEGGHAEAERGAAAVDPPSRSIEQAEGPDRDHDHAGGIADRIDGVGEGHIL